MTVFLSSISFNFEKPVKPVIILCTVLCISEEFSSVLAIRPFLTACLAT